jgi:hypothetical protein
LSSAQALCAPQRLLCGGESSTHFTSDLKLTHH